MQLSGAVTMQPRGSTDFDLRISFCPGISPAYVLKGKKHDVTVARKVPLAPGFIAAITSATMTINYLLPGPKTGSSL